MRTENLPVVKQRRNDRWLLLVMAFGFALITVRCFGGCLQFVNDSGCAIQVQYLYHKAGDCWTYPDCWYPYRIGYGYGPARTCLDPNQTKEATYSCTDASSICPFDAVKIVAVLVTGGTSWYGDATYYPPVGGGTVTIQVNCNGLVFPPSPPDVPNDANDGVPRLDAGDKNDCSGMPRWEVSEPYISLWLRDEPLGYQPALGPRISCQLDFKQREGADLNPRTFGFGRKWNSSWLSRVTTNGFQQGGVNFPDGGYRHFNINGNFPPDYLTGMVLNGEPSIGYTLTCPDGRRDIYGLIVSNGASMEAAYLTERTDVLGHSTRLQYDPVDSATRVVRLRYVIDGDGRTNTVSYVTTNGYSTNLISQVTDPFGRSAHFYYDDNGYLTNIVDVAGVSSSFSYGLDHVASMTTPYGTTTFTITEASDPATSVSGRSVLVAEPDGSHQLYLYKDNAPGVTNNYQTSYYPFYSTNDVPNTAPFENNFEFYGLDVRNSFHWGARQYAALSTTNMASFTANDFRKARRRHWLFGDSLVFDETLFLECAPSSSASGVTEGQKTWFDFSYAPISYGGSSYPFRLVLPANQATVLPGGITRYTHSWRLSTGAVTNEVSTYSGNGATLLRTNTYLYSTNKIDLLAVTNALGVQVVSNTYNAFHQVLTNINALGEKTIFDYNSNQQLSRIQWPSGLTTTNIYYASGPYSNWLAQTIDLEIGRTNSFGYTNGLVHTHTNALGLVTTNTWDALQRPLTVADGRGQISFTYANLDLIRVVDRLGFTNSFGYDALQRLTAATNTLGHYTLYDYCTCGALNSVRDAAGYYTYFYRDNLGRVTNAIYADSYRVTNTFNALGQLITVTDTGGTRITNAYNHQGLLVAVSNAYGRVGSVIYDALDRATNTTDANNVTVTNTFDSLNRLRTRGYPDGGVERFGYTANYPAPTSYTNQLTNVVLYGYDPAGRRTSDAVLAVSTNRFVYDAAGNLRQLIDGKNQTNQWRYDAFGRATNKTDAAGSEVFRYTYDSNDRLTNRWTPAKGHTVYRHDPLGNVTNIDYAVSPDLVLQYDSLNRLTNVADAVGTTKFSYNATSQLLSEDGPWSDDTVSYSYANRVRSSLSLLQPGAAAWSQAYGYDAMQRLTNVASPAGVFGYAYNSGQAGSLIRKLTLPGSYVTNSWDGMARLLSTKLLNAQLKTLNAHSYGYNVANQRAALTNVAGDYRLYNYDNAGQLITALGFETNGAARYNERQGYTYDPAGNLNFRTNHAFVQTFNVNPRNELTTATRTGTYTVAGNTTTRATNVTVNGTNAARYADFTWAATNFTLADGNNAFTVLADHALGFRDTNVLTVALPATSIFVYDLNGNLRTNGPTIYEYDDENQLVTNWVAAAWKMEFVYDGQGRKRIERVYGWTNNAWAKTNETRYVYDGRLAIQERDASNNPLVTYTRGLDLSGELQGAGGIGGLLARSDHTTTNASFATAYYHADGNGNVSALINTNGLLVARYAYDPFGNPLGMWGALADANRCRFSSKEYEPLSGLYYYGFRFYEPSLQRWLNADPLGEAGGINLHQFTANSPLNNIDQLGLEPREGGWLGAVGHYLAETIAKPIGRGLASLGDLIASAFLPTERPDYSVVRNPGTFGGRDLVPRVSLLDPFAGLSDGDPGTFEKVEDVLNGTTVAALLLTPCKGLNVTKATAARATTDGLTTFDVAWSATGNKFLDSIGLRNANISNIRVTIDPSLTGANLVNTAAHEGLHVAVAQHLPNFAASAGRLPYIGAFPLYAEEVAAYGYGSVRAGQYGQALLAPISAFGSLSAGQSISVLGTGTAAGGLWYSGNR